MFAFVATVYTMRGLVMVLGGGASAPKDDEPRKDIIPLAHSSPHPSPHPSPPLTPIASTFSLVPPAPMLEPHRLRGTGPVCASLPSRITHTIIFNRAKDDGTHHVPPRPPTRAQRYTQTLTLHLDVYIFGALLALSLPGYYATGYTAPAYVFLTTLTFLLALQLPLRSRTVLHPVLVCAAATILSIYVLASTARVGFKPTLATYKTGARYLELLRGHGGRPGAGDLFSSLLDVSIVSLALPMFHHRTALRQHAAHLALPVLLLAATSLGLYPLVARAVGVLPARAVAISTRSLTLAFASPAVENLGGDTQLTAVFCVTTGVMGVLVGPRLLKWLDVGEDEYLVRGVAMGGNGSAVCTAWLLARGEAKAAAVGSVVMVGFGVVTIAASAVGVIKDGVRVLAGI